MTCITLALGLSSMRISCKWRQSALDFTMLKQIDSIFSWSTLLWTIKYIIYQTRETVFHQDIQTPRSGSKNEAQPSFFNGLQGVWIPDETLFWVFDVARSLKRSEMFFWHKINIEAQQRKFLFTQILHWKCFKTIGSYLSCASSRYEALGKFGEHSRS